MTELRFAMTTMTPPTGRRKRATQRQTRHSFARSIVARLRSFFLASSASVPSCASLTSSHFSAVLPDTACRVESPVSHSKQTIARRSTRHWNEGVASTDFLNPRSRLWFGAIIMVRRFRHES
jgi:hypothetical protein